MAEGRIEWMRHEDILHDPDEEAIPPKGLSIRKVRNHGMEVAWNVLVNEPTHDR